MLECEYRILFTSSCLYLFLNLIEIFKMVQRVTNVFISPFLSLSPSLNRIPSFSFSTSLRILIGSSNKSQSRKSKNSNRHLTSIFVTEIVGKPFFQSIRRQGYASPSTTSKLSVGAWSRESKSSQFISLENIR